MTEYGFLRRPSRLVTYAVSAGLVALWGYVRLVAFDTTLFPLTYALPLLVGVWTRDRLATWLMAAAFVAMHILRMFWIMPAGSLTVEALWANVGGTLANILIAASIVHAIIGLRERLERAFVELRAQREELARQNAELAEQAEELSRQTEELSQQAEELAAQSEESQAQTEEIGSLNALLERREQLLETLLDTTRAAADEQTALDRIAGAALDLFGAAAALACVYELAPDRLRRIACAGGAAGDPVPGEEAFAAIVIAQGRTAALDDLSRRPDVVAPSPSLRSVLCAPIRAGARQIGAVAIYGARAHEWTDEEFRLIEWLADQGSRALQALRAQAELREADRRKDEFLATLSHELRNPLAPIRFGLSLIERGEMQDGRAVRIMQRQLRQLVRLVDDLLDATRISRNLIQVRRTRADLVAIVRQAVEASMGDIEAARHELVLRLPDEPVWIDLDPERFAQVVANLLNNATRYTPPGGRLTLTVTATEGEVTLAVADTGIGLRAEDCERMFEMFTQAAGPGSGGLGLGLAIVRGIVDLHGGRVAASSEGPGRGSEFRVTLPRVATAPPQAEDVRLPAPALHRRVLVVDDNVDAATMLATFLELSGHSVAVAHDAEGALAAAGRAAPDVALLDIGLPGVDGYELARRLRTNDATRHVRLIAVTGWGQDGDRARAHAAGFDAHLTKPVEPDQILSVLARG